MIVNRKQQGIALFEIFLMITATIAFAFILNSAFVNASPFEDLMAQQKAADAAGSAGYLTPGTTVDYNAGLPKMKSLDYLDTPVVSSPATPAKSSGFFAGKTGTKLSPVADTQWSTIQGPKTSAGGGFKWTLGDEATGTSYDVYKVKNLPDGGMQLAGQDGSVIKELNKDEAKLFKNDLAKNGGNVQAPTETNIMGMKFTGWSAHLVQGLTWSVTVVTAIQLLGRLFGASNNLINTLSIAAVAGIMTWKGILSGVEGLGWAGGKGGWLWNSAGLIGLGVAAVVFILLYEESEQRVITFSCEPWQPPLGGSQCEKCNTNSLQACSEYRCKALGQACQLLNAGTGNETCTWVSKFDVNSPTIKTNDAALSPVGLKYVPDTGLRPGMNGVKIIDPTKSDGCLQAFTKLKFGFTTNEPAQCKLEIKHTSGIKDMTYYVGDNSLYSYSHTQNVKLPRSTSTNDSGLPTLNNDGSYSMYVRCQDANGNQNNDEFVFSYCVGKSPDTTPPSIEGTSITSGSYVRYAVDNALVDLYVNEPSDCRWSRVDEVYDDMKNNMNCNSRIYEVNANLQYTCSANLTGIKDKEDNKFFFRCKDQSGNANAQGYPFILKGSQMLTVKKAAPNGTISGSTSITTVTTSIETSNGADDGKASCYYYLTNPSGAVDLNGFIQMFSTDSYISKQDLDLSGGDYKVYFRCVDSGGNIAEANTTFTLFVDKTAPTITRIYRELPDALKVVTSEEAKCSYSLTTCNYNVKDGLGMIYSNPGNKNIHLAQWKVGQTYYIKCADFYGNEPAPDQCNIVAGATQLSV